MKKLRKQTWFLMKNSWGIHVSGEGHNGGEVWEYDTELEALRAAADLQKGIRPEQPPQTWIELFPKGSDAP